jgi:hypothetical protein
VSAPGWAELSPCGTYRYLLGRRVGESSRAMLWVMLNPSTADATEDDATIRRCSSFARREGCGTLEVVNLFALRATDPAELRRAYDAVGSGNPAAITAAIGRTHLIVVAWGNIHRRLGPQRHIETLLAQIAPDRGPFCLGRTAAGAPRHPLYVKGDTPLEPWAP